MRAIISGVNAAVSRTLCFGDVKLTADVMSKVTSKEEFVGLLKSKFGEFSIDNTADATYNSSNGGVAHALRYGNFSAKVPVFAVDNVGIPAHIYVKYRIAAANMCTWAPRFVNIETGAMFDPIGYRDAHSSGNTSADGLFINQWKKRISGAGNSSYTVDIPSQTPNCFTDGAKRYQFQWFSILKYSGYATSPFYIEEFVMEF